MPGARGDAGVNAPMCVAEGDGVPLPEFGGSKIEMDGEEFEMTRETDIVSSTEQINSVGKKKVQSNIDKLLVKTKEAERKQWKCIKIKWWEKDASGKLVQVETMVSVVRNAYICLEEPRVEIIWTLGSAL